MFKKSHNRLTIVNFFVILIIEFVNNEKR